MLSLLTELAARRLAHRLDEAQARLARHGQRLASGRRVNSARDDAAGLTIAARLDAQRRGATADLRRLNDLVSVVQTADAALADVGTNLQRIRELSVQAANDSNRPEDRRALQLEADQLIAASLAIQATTRFNGRLLLDGSFHSGTTGGIDAALPPLDIAAPFQARTTRLQFRLAQFTQATVTVTPTAALQAGDLILDGQAIPAATAGAAPGQTAASAWALARAINAVGDPDLSAVAQATGIAGDFVVMPAGNVGAGQIVINGVPVGAGSLLAAINGISGQTGVVATLSSGATLPGPPPQTLQRLTLSAADGRDIEVSGAAAWGLGDATARGQVAVSGALAENGNLAVAGNAPGNAELAAGLIVGQAVGDPVAVPLTEAQGFELLPDLSSVDGAQATLANLDRKLDRVLTLRATLGAVANRLDAVAATLSTARDAAAAAASRIVDADYAQETAALARERILQAAGLALGAQANLEPRLALALLRRGLGR